MKRNLDEVIKQIEEYQILEKEAQGFRYNTQYSDSLLTSCQKLKAMGLEWGDKIDIPYHFILTRKYYLTNSKTHYKSAKDEWFVVWDNGNVGRLQFVSDKYWSLVGEEWRDFYNEMLSFSPLDYDPLNDHIIYNIENGKKAMANYKDLCKRTQEAMNKKIKEAQVKELEEQLAKLKG